MDDISKKFFTSLKQASRVVEQGVQEVQKEAEASKSSTGYSVALNKLIQLSKEAQEMKLLGREKTENLKQDGEKFTEMLTLCQSLVETQRNKLKQIEEYFQKYGYQPRPSVEENVQVDQLATVDDDEVESSTQQIVCTPPETSKPKDVSKTPKLEDFGLSRLTLNALARGQKVTYDHAKPAQKRLDSSNIPAIFHHDGLTVTPSLMGGKSLPCITPEKSVFDNSGSPLLQKNCNIGKGGKSNLDEAPQNTKLKLETLLTDSPNPPTFLTPAFKKMQMKRDHVETKDTTYLTNSPIPPAFITPLMKQMVQNKNSHTSQLSTSETQQSKESTAPMPRKPECLNFVSTGTPEPPELTMSLSAYADITGVQRLPATPEVTRTIKCGVSGSTVTSETLSLSRAPFFMNNTVNATVETPPTPDLTSFNKRGERTLPGAPTLLTSHGSNRSHQQSSSALCKEPEPPQLSQKEYQKEPRPFQFLSEKLDYNTHQTPAKPELLLKRATTNSEVKTAKLDTGKHPLTKNVPYYNTDMPQPPKLLGKYNFSGNENIPPY